MIKVKLISHTPDPQRVIAMSAKLCYSSSSIEDLFDGLTEDSIDKFLNVLMSLGHESPIEHASFTFGIEGISRSLSHQLVRHRIASVSQQSQRYVKLDQFEYIIPESIKNNEIAKDTFIKAMATCQKAYDELTNLLMKDYIQKYCNDNNLITAEGVLPGDFDFYTLEDFKNESKVYEKVYKDAEKKAIEDARYVFPNACETKIIMTFNARSLLNFFEHRCCSRAQTEIRDLANLMLEEVKKVAPILFKNAGPKCVRGKCNEGKLSCGKQLEMKEKYK